MTKINQDKKQDVYQLPNGKWAHRKTRIEFEDKIGAQTDFRFCCEWERCQLEGD